MAFLREHLNIVLHQVQSADNLGSIARLMRNFGFRRWVLSDPVLTDPRAGERLARRGSDLLDELRTERTLDAALGECVYAVGTTSRSDVERRRVLTPEEAVAQLVRHAQRGPVALVMGGERRGLSDEDLSRCQDICAIPTEPEPQPSMNLAQAACVMLYLCSHADRPEATVPVAEGAKLQTVHALEARMKGVLLRSEFLNPQQPNFILEEMLQSLQRGGLSQREVELWLAAFRTLERHVPTKNEGMDKK